MSAGRELGRRAARALAVDDRAPRYEAAPRDEDEVAATLSWATADRLAVIARGGGTRIDLGNIPRAYDVALSTAHLAGIVEYEPADLTITARAGTPFMTLQAALAENGQFLALDPQTHPGSTIGGIVATNASGPCRLRYGAARDLVIGTRVVTGSATIARSGGRVVKNVTGYDLNKLYIGSLGTLAVLTEITFKVAPRPPEERTLAVLAPDIGAACALTYRLLRSPLTPTAVEAAPADGGAVRLTIHLGDRTVALDRTVRDITAYAAEVGAGEIAMLDEDAARDALDLLRAEPIAPEGGVRMRLSVPVGEVAWAWREIESRARAAAIEIDVRASIGVGVLRAAFAGDESALPLVRALRALAREHLGTLVVERCPTAMKAEIDVLGEPGDSQVIAQRLKARFDPHGIMAPGRFLGRL